MNPPKSDEPKPFIVDDGSVRRLYFNLDYVQSEMRLDQPYTLNLAYTRKMMAFLLFVPQPRHVVIVGLGGGSLTKFCYRQLPRTRITTVEIDRDVIGFGEMFHLPPEDARLQIVHADAVEYFAATREQADVVLFDGCDRQGIAAAFCTEDFYRSVHLRLRAGGLLVTNLVGTEPDVERHVRHIAAVFRGRVMIQNVGADGNQLAFAFKDPAFRPDWTAIQAAAKRLAQQHGLNFPVLVRKLRHSRQFQTAARGR